MMTADKILRLARAYAAATDTALTTVGRRAVRNNLLFVRLADGRGCNIRSIERAAQWFGENWPQGVRWPKGIPRPKPPQCGAGDRMAA